MYFSSPLDLWVVTAQKAGATAASASKAAGAAGVQHIAKRVMASISAGATVQPVLFVNLIDGATGGATQLASWSVSANTNVTGPCVVLIDTGPADLNLVGTAATAMTLEFSAAPAASTNNSVTLIGYDAGGAKPKAWPVYTS